MGSVAYTCPNAVKTWQDVSYGIKGVTPKFEVIWSKFSGVLHFHLFTHGISGEI